MNLDLSKITFFINQHHVLSLATHFEDELSVCSLFYVFDEEKNSFIVASDDKTTHIKHVNNNSDIAGNILLETDEVSNIQGVQFKGNFFELKDEGLKNSYFEKFPYSIDMNPKLWKIEVNYFKMTDNSLGFGKKIIWTSP